MLSRSTLQLLRFHFSIFLMPIYWFGLSQVMHINIVNSILVFIIFHVLVYPSSNGYNSYMDRDTTPIGGLEKPLQPTRQLFHVTVIMDLAAILLSLFISVYFMLGIILYILASRAYSYRGIRLKKYPITGYLTVMIFQGGLCYYLVKHGCSQEQMLHVFWLPILAAALLIGGFYPLTQIYQHESDKADGITTISAWLGYKGTFIFTAFIYFLAMVSLGIYFALNLEIDRFFIFQLFMLPILVYFFWWMIAVWKNRAAANFKNTMRMNALASLFTNAGFITILILDKF